MKDVVGLLKKAAPLLLPSLMTLEIKSAVGSVLLQFRDTNDFILASIGATSANIRCELFNSFNGKLVVPRGIESCFIRLELVPSLADERLVYFMWEIANLKLQDGSMEEVEHSALVADLKLLSMEFSGAKEW